MTFFSPDEQKRTTHNSSLSALGKEATSYDNKHLLPDKLLHRNCLGTLSHTTTLVFSANILPTEERSKLVTKKFPAHIWRKCYVNHAEQYCVLELFIFMLTRSNFKGEGDLGWRVEVHFTSVSGNVLCSNIEKSWKISFEASEVVTWS